MSSSTDTLNRIYALEMRNHPYGYALYQPASTSVLHPGAVGYFDAQGFWSPLADLNDLEGLKALGLKAPKTKLMKAPDQKSSWGPIASKSTKGINFDASPGLGPAATGLPLSASIQIKYTTSSSFGAVLATTPPVTHSALYHQSPFSAWVADNASALLSGDYKEDIRTNGLVVVTQTYSTTKCALTAWTEGKEEAFLGFEASIPGVANIDPKGGWVTGNSAGGWSEYGSVDGSASTTGGVAEQVVVFIGGLWFDCDRQGLGAVFRSRHPTEDLGEAGEVLNVLNDKGERFELVPSVWGVQPAAATLVEEKGGKAD